MTNRINPALSVKTRFYFHLTIGDLRLFDRLGAELSPEEVMTPAALVVAKEIWPGLCDSDVWAGWSVEPRRAGDRSARLGHGREAGPLDIA
jgi:hypothetical protein